MYIEAVPNRSSPPAILLRESYRDKGKVRKRTLCNLSDWSPAHIEGLRGVLKGGTVIPAEQDAFTITRSVLLVAGFSDHSNSPMRRRDSRILMSTAEPPQRRSD